MLKKILWLLILIIFVVSGCAKKNKTTDLFKSIIKKDKIIVGMSFDAKPFGYQDTDGQIKGFEADLAREIAKRILGDGNKVVFQNITSQDRIKAVSSGDVDMVISTMSITPQRKKLVNFSIPYFVAGQAICVRKDSNIDSYYDLMNKSIIVILGTTGEKNIRRFAPNALVQSYNDNSEAINAFKNGDSDAITTDDTLLQGLIIESNDYILLPQRLTQEPYGIAFRKSKQTESLKRNINEIIKEIKTDGTFDALKNKWGLN